MTRLGHLAHSVRIDEARTGRPVWQSTPQTLHTVSYDRQFCDLSTAKLTFNAPSHILNQLEPWMHLVSIYEGNDLVWHGPMYRLKASRAGAELTAHDPSVWWPRRRVAQGRSYLNIDASQVARDLVTDAMGFDDPSGVVTFMRVEASGVWVTTELQPGLRMVSDEMNTLESAGLTWTVAAGRVLIGPVASSFTTHTLTDDHWDADISVVKDGAEVVTDMLVTGKGVYGYYIDPTREVGLLQGIEKADSLVRTGECESLAQRRVVEAKYPPRRLEVGGSSRLLPSAPVALHELVPGVLVPIQSKQAGITMSSVMMLRSVSVEETGSGESVSITLMERPSATVPELMPPLVPEDYSSPYDRDKRDKEQQMPRNDSTQGEGNNMGGTGQAPVV